MPHHLPPNIYIYIYNLILYIKVAVRESKVLQLRLCCHVGKKSHLKICHVYIKKCKIKPKELHRSRLKTSEKSNITPIRSNALQQK